MLEKKVTEDLKQALKGGEKTKVSVLRMLISEIKNRQIADRVKELDDEKVIALIQKMARQHNESIEKFREGKREDLVSKETEELEILKEYMPQQMSEEELSRVIDEAIEKTGASSARDMGKVMGDILPKIKGRADGKVVSGMVRDRLSQG